METTRSADGTIIAFDRAGEGPALVFVTGAMGTRADVGPVAALLAPQFTTYAYDRRGRGDSGDTAPYAPQREVEDLEAVIGEAGGEAFVFGHSSGAALALEAALHGLPMTKLALYEPPYIVNHDRPPLPADYVPRLNALIAEGRRGDAIEYFWRVGLLMPAEVIAQMRGGPMWLHLEELAHTIAYDGLVMGDRMSGNPLPAEWARLQTPTLVIDGGESPASMRDAVVALAHLLPRAQRMTLEGQGHGAPPEILAPVLEGFFLGRTAAVPQP
jgi:pimeloyl-ACP methyl ester carboxylesterase